MKQVKDMLGCRDCPLFGTGAQVFTPDVLVAGAPVLVMRDIPGATGPQQYAKRTGLAPEAFSVGSVLRCQPSIEGLALGTPLQVGRGNLGRVEKALIHCQKAHGKTPAGTRLIVTRGEYALWAVTGLRSVSAWRGWLVPRTGEGNGWKQEIWSPDVGILPVFVTYRSDPISARMDWRKIPRILRGEWPQRFPGYSVEPPKIWPSVSAFDTEFNPETRILTRYSLYDGGDRPWVIEANDVTTVKIPGDVTVYMHNIEADLDKLTAILQGGTIQAEDTMLMDSVLWSGQPHDLEYLGSLYCRLNRWKYLGYDSTDYSAGDAIATWDVALALLKQMQADPQSEWIYRNSVLPLTGMIMEAEQVGLALNQFRVQQAIDHFEAKAQDVQCEAEAYVGFPLQLSSPEQVARWLYQIEKVGVKQKSGRKYVRANNA